MAGRKKEELKLTTEQTEKLLEFYQEEVDLWNFSSANYHNKDCRRRALENILNKLNEEYPGINGSSKYKKSTFIVAKVRHTTVKYLFKKFLLQNERHAYKYTNFSFS